MVDRLEHQRETQPSVQEQNSSKRGQGPTTALPATQGPIIHTTENSVLYKCSLTVNTRRRRPFPADHARRQPRKYSKRSRSAFPRLHRRTISPAVGPSVPYACMYVGNGPLRISLFFSYKIEHEEPASSLCASPVPWGAVPVWGSLLPRSRGIYICKYAIEKHA